jgi:hypothetical protein
MRGLLVRTAVFVLGAIPLVSLIHALDMHADMAGLSVIVYTLVGSSYLAHYCIKHEDEIPTRSTRR